MSENLLQQLAVQEPKKVFINVILVPTIRGIMDALYSSSLQGLMDCIRPMRGLIASLDTKGKKDLKSRNERLMAFETNTSLIQREELETLFQEIMDYLHSNYLKEYRIRGINPKPKHISRD